MNIIKILIVDDEPMLLDVLSKVLKHHFPGCALDAASDVKSAAAAIKERQYDLVVSDRNMPDGKGTSLIPLVRERSKSTAFVLISSQPQAAPEGEDVFIQKPFTLDAIRKAATDALERRSKEQ